MQGSGGDRAAGRHLERLRAICDKYGILLIFDEVYHRVRRLGRAFGAQRFGVTPE